MKLQGTAPSVSVAGSERRVPRRGPLALWLTVCAAVVLGANVSRVQAYVAPKNFAESVMFGGGGSKYFTGSHAEGYTCQVCHAGGAAPDVNIVGLPMDGYDLGQTYRITVDWPDELPAVALNLEMTDAAGNRFGELRPVAVELLSAADRCSNGEAASYVEAVDLNDGRRILTMAKCGQRQMTFDWQAPLQPAEGWLSGSVVAADRKKNVEGDGVTNISRVFGARGAPVPLAGALAPNCSVPRFAVHSRYSGPWLLTLATCLWLRRQRRNTADSRGRRGAQRAG